MTNVIPMPAASNADDGMFSETDLTTLARAIIASTAASKVLAEMFGQDDAATLTSRAALETYRELFLNGSTPDEVARISCVVAAEIAR